MMKIFSFVAGLIALHIILPEVSTAFWHTLIQFFFSGGGLLVRHLDVLSDVNQMTAGYFPPAAPYTPISY